MSNRAFRPIDRPRLALRLQTAAQHPVVVIAAPAGYGKSVALRQYLASLDRPSLRFDVAAEHTGLIDFLRGLCEAVSPVAPHAATALGSAAERTRTSATRAVELAGWMAAHLGGFSGVVAIDDLHVAGADPEVAAFLVALIEGSKERIAWVLASRSTAGLPVATWVAYGDADLVVGEPDLRFTLEEARAAAAEAGLSASPDELEQLHELTGGWPTALGFALRSSTRSSDLRSVAATTREMTYRYFAEQVYAGLSEEERALLAVAIALPSIDVAVLEAAGFDRALAILEGLCERTAFLYAESRGVFRCHDLFKEFLRREIEREGHRRFEAVQERAARALESSGDLERALGAFRLAGARTDVQRLLERHGFDLIERARGDAVARAVDALDEPVRRGNARVLALRGMLQATAGKNARAEALLVRAIARAGADRELAAIATLRLAILVMNLGRDAGELLEALAGDETQTHNRRAEALSILAAHRAAAGDVDRARAGIAQIEAMLPDVDSDGSRAKVLQRLGFAFTKLGEPRRAAQALAESADLSEELQLHSLASRAFSALSNLAIHEEDDVAKQLRYAQLASASALQSGDVFDLQTSLLQMLAAEMRLGNAERSKEIEAELTRLGTGDSTLAVYVTANKAYRAGWEGRFAEAYTALAGCCAQLHFATDRIAGFAQCALFLSLIGKRDESAVLCKSLAGQVAESDTNSTYRMRVAAIVRLFCCLAEAINGRMVQAERIGRIEARGGDPFVTECSSVAVTFLVAVRRGRSIAGSGLMGELPTFEDLGYGNVSRLLRSVALALQATGDEVKGVLTPAEVEVLRQLAEGASPKQIAASNRRSVFTIQAHIANAIAKLGCHGRNEAIAHARRRGWLT